MHLFPFFLSTDVLSHRTTLTTSDEHFQHDEQTHDDEQTEDQMRPTDRSMQFFAPMKNFRGTLKTLNDLVVQTDRLNIPHVHFTRSATFAFTWSIHIIGMNRRIARDFVGLKPNEENRSIDRGVSSFVSLRRSVFSEAKSIDVGVGVQLDSQLRPDRRSGNRFEVNRRFVSMAVRPEIHVRPRGIVTEEMRFGEKKRSRRNFR